MGVGDCRCQALRCIAAAAEALWNAYASVGVAGEFEAWQGCRASVNGMTRGVQPRIARISRVGMKEGGLHLLSFAKRGDSLVI
jgi:hypothetical protein